MSNLEHAIENAIYAFYNNKNDQGIDPVDRWEQWDRKVNLQGFSEKEIDIIKQCAYYVRYTLCETEEDYLKLIGKQ